MHSNIFIKIPYPSHFFSYQRIRNSMLLVSLQINKSNIMTKFVKEKILL